MSKRRVAYYYDSDVGSFSYGLGHPMKPLRMRITHNLVSAYNMLPKMDVIRPQRASPLQMTRFHTDEFVDFLHRVTPETAMDMTGGGMRFLTGEDNPAFDGLFEFCSISAGGSLAAAGRINTGMADIAINWAGGLHHAKRGEASGFCYINDIVLAILELLRLHTRVLYIDIDFHHGDGVEEAFYTTDRVLTCSFHKQKDCFPGTGKVEDRGLGRGKGYAINVPFLQGVTDEDFKSVFEPVIRYILDWYRPDAVVLQCGADSLSGDKLGSFNLSMNGHADCVRFLRKANVPLILLGGGGYTVRNVSCVWTYETACAIGIDQDLDPNLPFNEYLEWFGPRYRLEVQTTNMTDENAQKNYLENTKQAVLENLHDLPFAPSAQIHETPRHTVAQSMGLTPEDPLDEDELDVQIRRRVKEALRTRVLTQSDNEEDDDEFSSEYDDPIYYFSAPGPSRNLYHNPHSYDSDDDVVISDNDDDAQPSHPASTFSHTNGGGMPLFPRRPSNFIPNRTRASHRHHPSFLRNQPPISAIPIHPQHSHGTRAATASATAASNASPPPRRLFFSSLVNGKELNSEAVLRSQSGDGTPVEEGPDSIVTMFNAGNTFASRREGETVMAAG